MVTEPVTTSVTGRAIAVLDTFSVQNRRQSLSSIARRSRLPLTTVHRLVHDLERESVLIRGADGSYEIASKVWRWGTLASVHTELREVALPYMEDVYALSHDAVQVAVLDGVRCLVVDRIAGSRTMSVLSKPGSRLPLHATGVGKVLLAWGSRELQDAALVSLDRYTETTITDPDVLRAQLRHVKSQGFATTDEELIPGASSLAVPVRGKGGKVIAALGVVAPQERVGLAAMAPVLSVTAAALSRQLNGKRAGAAPASA